MRRRRSLATRTILLVCCQPPTRNPSTTGRPRSIRDMRLLIAQRLFPSRGQSTHWPLTRAPWAQGHGPRLGPVPRFQPFSQLPGSSHCPGYSVAAIFPATRLQPFPQLPDCSYFPGYSVVQQIGFPLFRFFAWFLVRISPAPPRLVSASKPLPREFPVEASA